MNDLDYLAIVVAALAAFVISSVWYIVFDARAPEGESSDFTADTGRPPAWKLLVELVRSLIVAILVAGFANNLGIVDFTDAVQLGLAFWVGFSSGTARGLRHLGERGVEGRRYPRRGLAGQDRDDCRHRQRLAVRELPAI